MALRLLTVLMLLATTEAAAQQGEAGTEAATEAAAEAETPTEAATEAAAGTEAGAATATEAGAEAGTGAATGAAPEAGAEDPKRVEARKHFRQGVAFAAAGNCSAAIVEFEAAYALVPRSNALYNIAQCQERLFRYDLAIASYERYLAEAPADAPDRSAVEAALRTLGNLLGTVHVRCNVEAEVWVNDRLIGRAPGDVFIPAGGHALELRAEGYIPARAEVRLVGGQKLTLELTLAKAQTTVQVTETTGLPPTLFWIGVGASATSAAVGTVFALRVSSLRDEAVELHPFDPGRVDKRGETEDAELLADVFFGTAGVLAVATTVVAFVTDWDGAEDRGGDAKLRLQPVVGAGHVGLQLGGER